MIHKLQIIKQEIPNQNDISLAPDGGALGTQSGAPIATQLQGVDNQVQQTSLYKQGSGLQTQSAKEYLQFEAVQFPATSALILSVALLFYGKDKIRRKGK